MAVAARLRAIVILASLAAAGAGAGDAFQYDASATEADLQSSGAECRIADLFLHTAADVDGNAQPIDILQDPVQPNSFLAQMDYSMAGFDIEARAVPEDRCLIEQLVQSTTMVDPGSNVVVQLTVRDKSLPKSATNPKMYRLQVSRRAGTETKLKALKIGHGTLVPPWNLSIRNYTAYLDVTQDLIKVLFNRLDNGQVVGLASSLEEPLDDARRLQASMDPMGAAMGEVQYGLSTLSSALDVGRQRMIDVVVESADRSAVGHYKFQVQRPFCPEERRYFDGLAKSCTDICNEGSFGSAYTGRCSICLTRHCAVCDVQNRCSQCMEGFALQGSGKCIAGATADPGGGLTGGLSKLTSKVTTYTSQHVLLFVGASIAATSALSACLCVVCGKHGDRCSVRRYKRDRGPIDDSDEEDGYSERSLLVA